MAKDKIVRARVTAPTFINGVLHQPGEDAYVNLDELGVDSLDAETEVEVDGRKVKRNLTPSLEKHSTKEPEDVIETPIAAVAPHAPDAPAPQGMAPGSRQSGTGRIITPAPDFVDATATAPVGADKPLDQKEAAKAAEPAKTRPVKPSK